MAVNYYWAAGYQTAWSTTTPTTHFNDGSVGDTTTSESVTGGDLVESITGFYDNGDQALVTAIRFTYTAQMTTVQSSMFDIEGSNDHSTWATLDHGSLTLDGSPHSYVKSGLLSKIRYSRLSLQAWDGSAPPTIILSDWRFTTYDSTFNAQSFVTTMFAGVRYNATVSFVNTGTATWDANVTAFPNAGWSGTMVLTNGPIAPGGTGTFTGNVRAPDSTGATDLNFQLQYGATSFGAIGDTVSVDVIAASMKKNRGIDKGMG